MITTQSLKALLVAQFELTVDCCPAHTLNLADGPAKAGFTVKTQQYFPASSGSGRDFRRLMGAISSLSGAAWSAGLVALSVACGAADSSTRARDRQETEGAGVESSINTCPNLTFHMILPRVIRPGEAAIVGVFASDEDSNDTELGYAWSATSGEFVNPRDAFTEYTCQDAGHQVLSVSAFDEQGCTSELDLDVYCLEP